jgi:hypothetical protein
MEIWDHTRLQAEGRFRGLDADMQPPTACREDEGNRVRSVVPKLIANGESHALERGSPARGLRIGQSRGGKARGGGEEGGGLLSARDCGKAREKITVMRETKGDACVLPDCQQGTMEEST